MAYIDYFIYQAKLMRMSYDAAGAIEVLQNGLKGPRPQSFHQADGLVSLIISLVP